MGRRANHTFMGEYDLDVFGGTALVHQLVQLPNIHLVDTIIPIGMLP